MARRLGARAALVGVLVSLVCIGLLSRQVDLAHSWKALTQLDAVVLLVPLAVFLLNIPLRALRWQMIFPPSARPRFWPCLSVLGISNMANFLLPGRAGDLARCVLIGRGVSLADSSRALATLGVEKVLDGLALVGMVLFAAWALSPPPWVMSLVWVAGLIFGGALVLMIALRYRARQLIGGLNAVLGRLGLSSLGDKLQGPLASFAEGLAAVSSAGQMLRLLLLTAAIWASEAVLIWGLALAFGLAVSVKSAVVVSAVLGLGLMVPAAPGGLGTYELAGVAAFQLVGVAASSALALTVVIHAWVYLTNISLGLGFLAFRGMRLAQLKEGLKAEKAAS
jgi:glycosyltransferase 2 family protein